MAWTRKEKKRFRLALQGVYRNYNGLRIFVAEEMGWQLENIVASNQTLDTVGFEVIAWAEGNSALQELYEAFREENPNHPFQRQTPAQPQQPEEQPAPTPEPAPPTEIKQEHQSSGDNAAGNKYVYYSTPIQSSPLNQKPFLITFKIDLFQISLGLINNESLKGIAEETGTRVSMTRNGLITVWSIDESRARKAISLIKEMTRKIIVGGTYSGHVTRIANTYAFVELLPGVEGMLHISRLANYKVNRVEDEVGIGEKVTVNVLEIDSRGRINLNRSGVS